LLCHSRTIHARLFTIACSLTVDRLALKVGLLHHKLLWSHPNIIIAVFINTISFELSAIKVMLFVNAIETWGDHDLSGTFLDRSMDKSLFFDHMLIRVNVLICMLRKLPRNSVFFHRAKIVLGVAAVHILCLITDLVKIRPICLTHELHVVSIWIKLIRLLRRRVTWWLFVNNFRVVSAIVVIVRDVRDSHIL